MEIAVTKTTTIQPRQYYSHTIGGTFKLSSEDEYDIREIASREGLQAPTFVELAHKVAVFLANQHYEDELKDYKALPASHFDLGKK